MSYILDALKKSEKERQRGKVPELLTTQDVMIEETKKRLLWPYLLLIALLLNAGVLVWLLGSWHSKKPAPVVESTAGQQREAKVPESMHEVSNVPQATSTLPAKTTSQEVRTAVEDSTPMVKQAEKQVIPKAFGIHQNQRVPANNHFSDEPQSGTNSGIASEPGVVNLKDLPLSIQQGLPSFAITVAVHSDNPSSRMVKINGQMLQEGQYLTDGLKLEEITPEGVIFSYQNYRFRVGLR